MQASPQQIESLKARLKTMSAADMSVLTALPDSLKEQETVRLVTVPGSANDLLWSEMAALGWMSLDEPLQEHAHSKVYIVRTEAQAAIEMLLTEVKRDDLPKLFNELRRQIPPLIVPPVLAAGGTPSDVVMMLAGIVDATMRRWIRPELHEEFMKAVSDRTRDLSQMKTP